MPVTLFHAERITSFRLVFWPSRWKNHLWHLSEAQETLKSFEAVCIAIVKSVTVTNTVDLKVVFAEEPCTHPSLGGHEANSLYWVCEIVCQLFSLRLSMAVLMRRPLNQRHLRGVSYARFLMNLPVLFLTVAKTMCGRLGFGTLLQRNTQLFFGFPAICIARFAHGSHCPNGKYRTTIHTSDFRNMCSLLKFSSCGVY